MRPTSIISLVVSVLLIIVGLTTCIIAQNMANANGEALFSEMKSEGYVSTVDLSDVDISKIELIVTDAEINICGTSETSYIEFVNFRENYYTLAIANKTLSFDEIPDMVSMLKFWENGFSFKGMRHVFNFKKDTDSQKAINVYIGSDLNIKIFNISADNCVLKLDKLALGSDYNLNIENGELEVTALKTTSAFKANGKNLKIHAASLAANTVEVAADSLQMKVDSFRANGSAKIEAALGSIDLTSAQDMNLLNLDLDTVTGTVRVNGTNVGTSFRQSNGQSADHVIQIITDSADISVRQGSIGGAADPFDETVPETSSPEETE